MLQNSIIKSKLNDKSAAPPVRAALARTSERKRQTQERHVMLERVLVMGCPWQPTRLMYAGTGLVLVQDNAACTRTGKAYV